MKKYQRNDKAGASAWEKAGDNSGNNHDRFWMLGARKEERG